MDWLYRFWEIVESVEARVITAASLAVALGIWLWNIRQARRREQQDLAREQTQTQARTREREEERAKVEAAEQARRAEERRKLLDSFQPHSLSCAVDGELLHLVWGGDLDRIPELEPVTMTPALIGALLPALCQEKRESLQPFLRTIPKLTDARTVYLTDEGRQWKRKLESQADPGSFLRVKARQPGPCLGYCPKCGRTGGPGTNCVHCPDGKPTPFRGLRTEPTASRAATALLPISPGARGSQRVPSSDVSSPGMGFSAPRRIAIMRYEP